jgi:hypothetical protein
VGNGVKCVTRGRLSAAGRVLLKWYSEDRTHPMMIEAPRLARATDGASIVIGGGGK